MIFVSHHVDRRLVVELDEVLDPETIGDVETDLRRLMQAAGAALVVIDVRTPLLTSTALHMLMRARRSAQLQGAVLCVVARRPLARRVLHATGLTRALRASATMSGALALARSCPPASCPEAGRCDAPRTTSVFRPAGRNPSR